MRDPLHLGDLSDLGHVMALTFPPSVVFDFEFASHVSNASLSREPYTFSFRVPAEDYDHEQIVNYINDHIPMDIRDMQTRRRWVSFCP